MNKELKLEALKTKKRYYKYAIERIDKQIYELEDDLREVIQHKQYVKNKCCIVCGNRIPEHDFKIPDGIVCGHPSNKDGKDRFQSTHHTCKYWKQEEKK